MRYARFFAFLAIIAALTIGTAEAGDNVKFNYQGRALVNGLPFTGTSAVKLAIVNTSGTVTLWSNDGTSTAGSQPTSATTIQVANGVFDIMVGDTARMAALPGVLFNNREDLCLRVWFNDGVHGFQQLTPDREITNAHNLGLTEASGVIRIYVNIATGNDVFSGLSASQPKKTLQAGIDMAPKSVGNNGRVLIEVYPGVYREEVHVKGIRGGGDAAFIIEAATIVNPTVTIDPNVRITGSNNDVSSDRYYGMYIYDCEGLAITGILFDRAQTVGVNVRDSSVNFASCKAKLNGKMGFACGSCSYIELTQCWAVSNTVTGIIFDGVASSFITSSGARLNGQNGVWLYNNSSSIFRTSGDFSQNIQDGLAVYGHSRVSFESTYSGTIQNNGGYGIRIRYQSHTLNQSANVISGNSLGSTETSFGGVIY